MEDSQFGVDIGIGLQISLGGHLGLLGVFGNGIGGLTEVGHCLGTFAGTLGSGTLALHQFDTLLQGLRAHPCQLVEVELVLRHACLVAVRHNLSAGAYPSDGIAGHTTSIGLFSLHSGAVFGLEKAGVHLCLLGLAGFALGFQFGIVLLAGCLAAHDNLHAQEFGNGTATTGFGIIALDHQCLATQTGGYLLLRRTPTATQRHTWRHLHHLTAINGLYGES